jgi:hypothetical protein
MTRHRFSSRAEYDVWKSAHSGRGAADTARECQDPIATPTRGVAGSVPALLVGAGILAILVAVGLTRSEGILMAPSSGPAVAGSESGEPAFASSGPESASSESGEPAFASSGPESASSESGEPVFAYSGIVPGRSRLRDLRQFLTKAQWTWLLEAPTSSYQEFEGTAVQTFRTDFRPDTIGVLISFDWYVGGFRKANAATRDVMAFFDSPLRESNIVLGVGVGYPQAARRPLEPVLAKLGLADETYALTDARKSGGTITTTYLYWFRGEFGAYASEIETLREVVYGTEAFIRSYHAHLEATEVAPRRAAAAQHPRVFDSY